MPLAFHGSPGHSRRRPSKIRHRESRPFLPTVCLAANVCLESSERMLTTPASPRERGRSRDKGKLQPIHAYSQGTTPARTEKLYLLQLILGLCCRAFLILNLLLILGTEIKRFYV